MRQKCTNQQPHLISISGIKWLAWRLSNLSQRSFWDHSEPSSAAADLLVISAPSINLIFSFVRNPESKLSSFDMWYPYMSTLLFLGTRYLALLKTNLNHNHLHLDSCITSPKRCEFIALGTSHIGDLYIAWCSASSLVSITTLCFGARPGRLERHNAPFDGSWSNLNFMGIPQHESHIDSLAAASRCLRRNHESIWKKNICSSIHGSMLVKHLAIFFISLYLSPPDLVRSSALHQRVM